MITAEKCRIHATECRVRASSIDIPAERSLEQSIMALNWEALADQIDHDHSHGTPAAFSVSNLSEAAAPKGCGNMPKYFFVVRHGDKTSHHSDGMAFPNLGAVQLAQSSWIPLTIKLHAGSLKKRLVGLNGRAAASYKKDDRPRPLG